METFPRVRESGMVTEKSEMSATKWLP